MRNNLYVITGGAGFIGVNVAAYYLERGADVMVVDDFSRRGSKLNARWLTDRFDKQAKIVEADISSSGSSTRLLKLVDMADVVFHFAAQVAVTTSVVSPADDFRRNAYGTFCVLEAIRKSSRKPVFVYSNKQSLWQNGSSQSG
jgi:CDP-paratose 2-epimerase